MVKGIFAGSFDPLTRGHIDLINRSMRLCSQLVIAIGVNPDKKTMFSEEERLNLINKAISTEFDFLDSTNMTAISFNGLMVELAREVGANLLIRGIRNVSDFEYEINLANLNKQLAPDIETIFLPTKPELLTCSSSAVKTIARFGGDINQLAPSYVAEAVKNKFGFVKYGDPEK